MRAVIVTKENTDYARAVTEFLHDFERQLGRSLEVIDPDTPSGSAFCETYDIVEYPTIVALADDGSVQNSWTGVPLPTINEVSYYA